MTASNVVNIAEIVLWSLLGVVFAVAACRPKAKHRLRLSVLALAFLAFGVSDYIELQTGAWWRPLWLLLLKATCVVVFILALRRHLAEQAIARRLASVSEDEGADPPASGT